MKTVIIPKKIINDTLKTKAKKGNRPLDPMATLAKINNLPFKIIEDKKSTNMPELHVNIGDLFHCLEGTVNFICGGVLTDRSYEVNLDGTYNKNEIKGIAIINGSTYTLQPGDWIWIPPNTPHQHNTSSTVRLMIIKVPLSIMKNHK